jgi:NAD(P) transhydrogenase subunit alpha
MIVGVVKETCPGENRVALVPASIPALLKKGVEVVVEKGAGFAAGFPDSEYQERGARLANSRADVLKEAPTLLFVRGPGSDASFAFEDLGQVPPGAVLIGFLDPLIAFGDMRILASKGLSAFSMEMMPRITRAQSMDALSSMATIAGYKAVLLAADRLPRMFPMLMTAAGTVSPARVFVVGVGVAGLQAISTAKRLGAVVQAYDVRPAVKEQVQSVGAKFVEMEIDASESEDKGGYAKELGEDFYRKQRELMTSVLAQSDVVITTAAVPGKKAPILVTKEMVEVMAPGSVVVDLAAERGGNCELTCCGQTTITPNGVTILGPENLPSTVPYHASQMYAKNITTFLLHLAKEGELKIDLEDEITKETLITHGGEVVHPRVKELMEAK